MSVSDNRYRYACYSVIAFVILARIPYLTWPLFSEPWRETQTALTIWSFGESGHISLLDYETPLFGPPWRVPMELPVFQILAYLLKVILHVPYDVAGHATGLAMFCLSAYLTRRLCAVLTGNEDLSLLAAVLYVITPYAQLYSTACLIEYCAIACCLAYVLGLFSILQNGTSRLAVCSVLVLGILAYCVKGTAMVAYLVLVLVMGTGLCWDRIKVFGVSGALRRKDLWTMGLCLVVPVLFGYAWVKYTDGVKLASGYAAQWSSAALGRWNYGTIAQRLDIHNWWIAYARLWRLITPYAWVVVLAVGLLALLGRETKQKAYLVALAAGLVVPICLLFNLYIPHSYYFLALTPIAAIFVAIGMVESAKRCQNMGLFMKVLVIGVLVGSLLLPYYLERRLLFSKRTPYYVTVGQCIGDLSPRDGKVFVLPHDTTGPAILYYAKRRGLIARRASDIVTYAQHIMDHRYTHIVCTNELRLAEMGLPGYQLVTNCIGYNIYRSLP